MLKIISSHVQANRQGFVKQMACKAGQCHRVPMQKMFFFKLHRTERGSPFHQTLQEILDKHKYFQLHV